MEREWREFFLLWAETEDFEERVRRAHERLEAIKENFSSPAILFSGGKDSTVGVHLALHHFPDIPVFHYVYSFEVPEQVEREILANARKLGVRNLVVRKEKTRLRDDRGFFSEVWKFVRDYRIDCIISCLRAEESRWRKTLTSKGITEFQGVANVHVIRDWTWKDVWAYIVKNGLPYLSVYDRYGELEGWDEVRFAGFFFYDGEYLNKESVDRFLMWRHFNSD
ncbi:phosphoadenosine phosphosulfate reductase domain-containing protein [Geoglobus ahangari]